MEGIKRSLLFALFLIMCTLVQAQRLTVQGKVVSKTAVSYTHLTLPTIA